MFSSMELSVRPPTPSVRDGCRGSSPPPLGGSLPPMPTPPTAPANGLVGWLLPLPEPAALSPK